MSGERLHTWAKIESYTYNFDAFRRRGRKGGGGEGGGEWGEGGGEHIGYGQAYPHQGARTIADSLRLHSMVGKQWVGFLRLNGHTFVLQRGKKKGGWRGGKAGHQRAIGGKPGEEKNCSSFRRDVSA